jgi:phosphoglycolate phosphatase-like HAD superfamily hydrolase
VAVCTSDDREPTLKILRILNVLHMVDKIICGDDLVSSKPSPEPIWEICKKLNVLSSQTIMIGDTISDIQAGINSRCKQVYGVLSGGYSSNHLQNADRVFNNITEAVDTILS